jgi:hypothetical protein
MKERKTEGKKEGKTEEADRNNEVIDKLYVDRTI